MKNRDKKFVMSVMIKYNKNTKLISIAVYIKVIVLVFQLGNQNQQELMVNIWFAHFIVIINEDEDYYFIILFK